MDTQSKMQRPVLVRVHPPPPKLYLQVSPQKALRAYLTIDTQAVYYYSVRSPLSQAGQDRETCVDRRP